MDKKNTKQLKAFAATFEKQTAATPEDTNRLQLLAAILKQ